MALIELREHKRSSVSKLMSSLARYIQRCDTDKVNDYVTRLNSAFDDFEPAHEMLLIHSVKILHYVMLKMINLLK